jgi:hypothetical protein
MEMCYDYPRERKGMEPYYISSLKKTGGSGKS